MKTWVIIELTGTGRRTFVESYSNTAGAPRPTFVPGNAKQFSDEAEAHGWAKQYLPGYNYTLVNYPEL